MTVTVYEARMENASKCLSCNNILTSGNQCVCPVCGTIQSADCIMPGDKLIYYPTIVREREELEAYCNKYHFYPGMEMTFKKKIEDRFKKGFFYLVFEEPDVDEEHSRFVVGDFRAKEYVTEKMRLDRFMYYLTIWHNDKFKFFKFRKGQEVLFEPSYITKIWYNDEPLFAKLNDGKVFTIKKTIKRRYLWLDEVDLNIYWKDVKKIV